MTIWDKVNDILVSNVITAACKGIWRFLKSLFNSKKHAFKKPAEGPESNTGSNQRKSFRYWRQYKRNRIGYWFKKFWCEEKKHPYKLWTVIPHNSATFDAQGHYKIDPKDKKEYHVYMKVTSVTIQRALDPKDQQEQETAYTKWVYWWALDRCNHALQFNGSNTTVIKKEPYALELHTDNLEDIIQKIHKEFADYKVNISERYPLLWIVPPDTLRCEFIAKNKNFMLHIENHVKYATYRDDRYPTMIVELPKSWITTMHAHGKLCYPNGFYAARVYPTAYLYILQYASRDYTTYKGSWCGCNPFDSAKRDEKGEWCTQWMDKEQHFLAIIKLSAPHISYTPTQCSICVAYDWHFHLESVPNPEKPNETIAPIVEVLMPEPKLK